MNFRQLVRIDAAFIVAMLIVGVIAGSAYVILANSSLSPLAGGMAGFVIAVVLATLDLAVFPRFAHWPLALLLLVRSVAYTAVALSVVLLSFSLTSSASYFLSDPRKLLGTTLITLVICYTANFFLAIRRILGKNVLWMLFIGRYRRPVEENRMFMFIDLASSTAVAEKIGHVKYHQLLHKFQCDIADVILESRGDIYKYVGDEVIVTWPLLGTKLVCCWFECFFGIRERIRERQDEYYRLFGVVPRFRASLHCGPVVAGEMGDWKREIGFIGDTVNTTARILDTCKSNEKDFIVSEDVIRRTSCIERYAIELIPDAALKGKQGKVTLFCVEQRA